MTNLPKVTINLGNGRLGAVTPTADGVAALVVNGVATASISLNDPRQLFSPRDLDALGINLQNNEAAWKDVQAFYARAGEGAELWLTLYSAATNLAVVCGTDPASSVQRTLSAAGGRVRLLGVNRVPPIGYTPIITTGLDADVLTALTNLQNVLVLHATGYRPVRAFLPGIAWSGLTAGLLNLRTRSENRCAVVLGADTSEGNAAIGLVLGRAASISVHRNIGRVKDGLMANEAWFTGGINRVARNFETMWAQLHEFGFIFLRSYQGKNGFFFNDDPMAAPVSDDYSSLAHGRVIDKAMTIAYTTYIDELLDTVEIDQDGKLPAATCKYFEARINNAVNTLMAGEISSFRSFVDPAQNVLGTGRLTVAITIVPLGTLREIVVQLGFENPAFNQ